MTPLEQPEGPVAGRFVDANLHLLDRQLLDRNGAPVTTVEDLELSEPILGGEPGSRPPPPGIAALRPPHSRLATVPWSHITHIGTTLKLDLDAGDLDLTWTRTQGPRPRPRRPS